MLTQIWQEGEKTERKRAMVAVLRVFNFNLLKMKKVRRPFKMTYSCQIQRRRHRMRPIEWYERFSLQVLVAGPPAVMRVEVVFPKKLLQ